MMYKRRKLYPYLTPFTEINMTWIKDLHMRPKTVKGLEENRSKKLLQIGLGNKFWVSHQKHWQQKQKLTSGVTTGATHVFTDR